MSQFLCANTSLQSLSEPDDGEAACWTWTVRDPRTGERNQVFTAPPRKELPSMAKALRRNQAAWSAGGLEARIGTLKALAAALASPADVAALHAALSKDTGRARIAFTEIDSVVRSIHAWCAIAPGLTPSGWSRGRTMPHIRHRSRFVPYALVTVVAPWNFPLLLSMIDTLPALLAGCAVWIKPSEVTPRFIEPLRQIIAAIPELAGILNIVPGDGRTAAGMIELGDCVCFTGSVATGKKVALQAAARFIPAFLELGGKDPLIVLEGADLDAATDSALRGSVLATGQACQSIERIYVARAIHDQFTARLVEKARAVRFNYPAIGAGDIGPIIFETQASILAAQIADARAQGALVLTGGQIETHGGGLWLAPTVITQVTHGMKVMMDESFGPILPVMAFDSVEQAVELANDSQFGLSAAVFGPRIEECEVIAGCLEAGAVSINDAALTALFHEAGKQSFRCSGLGPSRMGAEGYTRFMRRQALIVNEAAPLPLHAFREEG
jgi:acyl-CoA reductase-like NAD-dependent aldehyde dehydrogenase